MIYFFNEDDHLKFLGYNIDRNSYDQNFKMFNAWYDYKKMIKVFIDQDLFYEKIIDKHTLRVWLTANCKFDVVVALNRPDMHRYRNNDNNYGYGNGYLFYFDDTNDAMLFKLRWA
jgi:hypothetical protein